MNFSAVILAGGRSTRMGRDKAWLEVDGQTLLARQIELVKEAGAGEVFISGRADADYGAFGCRVLTDTFQNAGPLAGIERALTKSATPLLLVLAVDLPTMSREVMQRLAAETSQHCGVVPTVNGQLEPLAAFYPRIAHAPAVEQLERGRFAVKDFAGHCVQSGLARVVELPASLAVQFTNLNAPADLPLHPVPRATR